jgi:hypothetical protein
MVILIAAADDRDAGLADRLEPDERHLVAKTPDFVG